MEHFTPRRILNLLAICAAFYAMPLLLSRAALPEATRIAVLAGTAISLNLLVGITGLISLAQGLFMGFGAYVTALGTLRYGLNFYQSGLLAVVATIPLSAIVALISLRARHLFFGLLTMAIGQVAFYFVSSQYELTGGEDGLAGVVVPHWLDSDLSHHITAVSVMLVVSLAILRLIGSPFGAVLAALRDNPDRVASLGGNPKLYEFVAFVLSGTFAAVYGVLFAAVEGNVDPTMISWTTSNLLIVMIALGGRFTFLGPIFGAVIIESVQAYTQSVSDNSDFVVGVLIIVCTLALPDGLGDIFKRLGRLRAAAGHRR
jgi:branched-chain amino acid transport system permease protein